MDERMNFIVDWQREELSTAALCRQYGVSRKTGYKWIERFEAFGPEGLQDRSSAAHQHPNEVAAEIAEAVIGVRAAHPSWGPKKIKAWLSMKQPQTAWPAQSTIAELLDRRGLVRHRRKRPHVPPQGSPLSAALCANDVWGIDFKGWFRTGDGARCEPLSLSDLASRYVLRLQALAGIDGEQVWPILETAFFEFGLPEVIRSDNGPPFASTAAGGLSRLSVRLIKAGVMPERIKPGRPQQNGRHERMSLAVLDHRLKQLCVGAIRDRGQGVVELAVGTPHPAGLADHRRHRSVDDEVAGHVQAGDAFVGIDHGEARSFRVLGDNIGLDRVFFSGW